MMGASHFTALVAAIYSWASKTVSRNSKLSTETFKTECFDTFAQ